MKHVVRIQDAEHPMHSHFLKGPVAPALVKRNGYGFTAKPEEAWPFPTAAQAASKARIINRHIGWADDKAKGVERP